MLSCRKASLRGLWHILKLQVSHASVLVMYNRHFGMSAKLDTRWGPCAVQHRYYGKSHPFGELLPPLTAQQSMMHAAAAPSKR